VAFYVLLSIAVELSNALYLWLASKPGFWGEPEGTPLNGTLLVTTLLLLGYFVLFGIPLLNVILSSIWMYKRHKQGKSIKVPLILLSTISVAYVIFYIIAGIFIW
jgi:hypothetical protein